MRDADRPELQHSLDSVIRQERRLAHRLYRRRRPWLPTLVEVGVVAIGAAGLWAAANFDRNADAGALFLAHRQSASPTFAAAAPPLPEVTAAPAVQAWTAPFVYQGSQSTTAPTASQVDSYLKRARDLVTLGDIAAVRLLLSRASEGKVSLKP